MFLKQSTSRVERQVKWKRGQVHVSPDEIPTQKRPAARAARRGRPRSPSPCPAQSPPCSSGWPPGAHCTKATVSEPPSLCPISARTPALVSTVWLPHEPACFLRAPKAAPLNADCQRQAHHSPRAQRRRGSSAASSHRKDTACETLPSASPCPALSLVVVLRNHLQQRVPHGRSPALPPAGWASALAWRAGTCWRGWVGQGRQP